jgi:hypothetical protein
VHASNRWPRQKNCQTRRDLAGHELSRTTKNSTIAYIHATQAKRSPVKKRKKGPSQLEHASLGLSQQIVYASYFFFKNVYLANSTLYHKLVVSILSKYDIYLNFF